MFDETARLQDSIHRIDASLGARAEAEDRGGRAIHLLTANDLKSLPHHEWAVKGVLPRQGLAALFGPSGSGKSFLALDLIHAISRGEDWQGYRVKIALPVCYVGLEGQAAIPLRVEAITRVKGPLGDDFRFLLGRWQLTNVDDVADLGEALRSFPGAVVAVDTLHAANPQMDENSSRDMGLAIEGAKTLQRITGGLVLLVHHSGKDALRGMRGHSSLKGALDAAIEVQRDGDYRAWSLDKAKDGPDGVTHSFRLRQVVLGIDDDGDQIDSCVIEPSEQPRETYLTQREVTALDVLRRLSAKSTTDLGGWKTALVADGVLTGSPDAIKKAMGRIKGRLIDAGLIKPGMGRHVFHPTTAGSGE